MGKQEFFVEYEVDSEGGPMLKADDFPAHTNARTCFPQLCQVSSHWHQGKGIMFLDRQNVCSDAHTCTAINICLGAER